MTSNSRKAIVDDKTPLLPTKNVDQQDESKGASFSGAVFNLSTTIVGCGIMALPATFKFLGLILGMVAIVSMASLTEASFEFMIRFSRAAKAVSYGGLMADTFGKTGRIMGQSCILVNNIGVLVVYMIIIGDVLSGTTMGGVHHTGVLESWLGQQWYTARIFVLLVTTVFVFAPLASLKKIDSLRYTSALSVGLAVVFLVIMVGMTLFKLIDGTIPMPRMFPDIHSFSSFLNLFTVVPILVTAYVCHYNVHSIDNELADNTQIMPVLRVSLALCSSVYMMTSLFGFLLFGSGTLDDVLANFSTDIGIPQGTFFNDLVRISYAGHLMLVFPVIFYPLRFNLDGLLFPTSGPLTSDNTRFASLSVVLIVVIFLGANFIPSIWDAFQFTGATAAVCIGFIFPAAIILKDRYGIASKRDRVLSIFMIVLAVFSNLVAIYSNAYQLVKKHT